MNVVARKQLKDRLDRIDRDLVSKAKDKVPALWLLEKHAMWRKGREVLRAYPELEKPAVGGRGVSAGFAEVERWPHAADLFGAPRLRYWILYFPFLCSAAQKYWRHWAKEYGERPTPNDGYVTLNTYPLRSVVAAAIREFTSGTTGGEQAA